MPTLEAATRIHTRVLVCGSRHWTDEHVIRVALTAFEPGDVLIHGGAAGADTIAGQAATALGMTVEVYPADWDKHGRAAGPIRNQRMIDEGKPHIALAFPLPGARGTADMVRRLTRAGIPILLPIEGDVLIPRVKP